MEQELKSEVIEFLQGINERNFPDKYNELIQIVLKYGRKGVSKETVLAILFAIDDMWVLNTGQDELIMDISSRIEGKCASGKEINW